ncbi:MAG: phosphate/phosphite/phosphonate ABC transporter substrate-binding protein [Chloroflexi bacterium]|nr:phosphate/phosphite/phosphonate ABC transporter substrate-binding protein [Chloroflexota bacterium]
MCAGEADAVALNTFSYIVASERGCAEVALVSVRFGSSTYAGQLVTRADTGIESVEDLAGSTFCRPDAFSTSGWIIPSITMRANGVDPDTDLTEVVDAGGHDGVVRAIYDGDCDAGSTFVDARCGIEGYEDAPDGGTVISESPPIPNDNVSFGTHVPQDVRDQVTEALLEMAGAEADLAILEDLYSWSGLERQGNDFYDEFRQQLDAAGISAEDFLEE